MLIDQAEIIPLQQLDAPVRDCLLNGDGVYDHYGNKPPFLILNYDKSRLNILELLPNRSHVAVHSVVNGTGGYGAGILGGDVAVLSDSLNEGLLSCASSNDEFGSLDRHFLTKKVKDWIAQHTKWDDWEITFTTSGTEAMDFAFQMVQLEGYELSVGIDKRAERNVIVACRGAWHGWGTNPNQLLDRKQFTDGIPRLDQYEVVFHQYGDKADLEAIFQKYAGRIRAVFVEGILGDGGIVLGSRDWWELLLDRALKENARVVDDEILTCFRTGGFLAIPNGLVPDCVVLGKGLGFGVFPLSAVAWKKGPLSPRPGIGVRTFNARPLVSKVVLEGLNFIEKESLFDRSISLGQKLIDALNSLPPLFPDVYKAVRGKGLMVGVELANPWGRKGRQVRDELIRCGTLTELESGLTGAHIPRPLRINQTIRLTPPLTIPEEEIEAIATSFFKVGEKLSKQVTCV